MTCLQLAHKVGSTLQRVLKGWLQCVCWWAAVLYLGTAATRPVLPFCCWLAESWLRLLHLTRDLNSCSRSGQQAALELGEINSTRTRHLGSVSFPITIGIYMDCQAGRHEIMHATCRTVKLL